MSTSKVPLQDDEIAALSQQLKNSLKFHHRDTLQKLPLELAIRAMTEAWNSCHSEDVSSDSNGASTAIIPREQAAKSIRESKYFSG